MKSLVVICSLTARTVLAQTEQTKLFEAFEEENSIDTVLERNSPTALDLAESQLFIDTSRNSYFYKNIARFQPTSEDQEVVKYYIDEIKTDFPLPPVELSSFPKRWVSLRKLNNEFMLYHRCEGNDKFIDLSNESVAFYGPVEAEADMISKIVSSSENEIQLELKTIKAKTENQTAFFTIKKTENENVFLYTYKIGDFEIKEFVTPIEKINQFNMVVNHCINEKHAEFNGFDDVSAAK